MYEFVKRTSDIILCSIATLVFLPLMLITALAIKVSSKGPIFYISNRTGINGKPFKFFKFRSMHLSDRDKGLFIADQERLFPVGRIIRRTKIDELPQLINVLMGQMSIVGPRPMPIDSVDKIYCGKYSVVKILKPGLTSPASLYDYMVGDQYTDDTAYQREVLPVKRELELYYLKKRSLHYDLQLILRTIAVIFAVMAGKKEFKTMKEVLIVKNSMSDKDNG